MPKIKVKNIPEATYKRICTNCIKCSRAYCFQFNTVAIPGGHIPSHTHKDVIELSEQEFPTNREWMESLLNEELAALLTISGLLIHSGKYAGMKASLSLITDKEDMLDWLSQPCRYLEEE
jgi:hypothetical protein